MYEVFILTETVMNRLKAQRKNVESSRKGSEVMGKIYENVLKENHNNKDFQMSLNCQKIGFYSFSFIVCATKRTSHLVAKVVF